MDTRREYCYTVSVTTTLLGRLERNLQLAAMVDEHGRIGAGFGIPSSRLRVPRYVGLDEQGQGLLWSDQAFDGGRESSGYASGTIDTSGVLDAFVRVHDANGVLRFADKFGPLEICERHGLPSSHHPLPRSLLQPGRGTACRSTVLRRDSLLYWEPLEQWFSFSRQARSILALAASLHGGSPGDRGDWQQIYKGVQLGTDVALGSDLAVGRVFLGMVVDDWLAVGGVELSLHMWGEEEPFVELTGGTFGALAVQLAAAVTRKHSFAVCDGCRRPYLRARKPQSGRHNYCPDCRGLGVDSRDRQRAHRARRG